MIFLLLICGVCLIVWLAVTLLPEEYLNPKKPSHSVRKAIIPSPDFEPDFFFSDDADYMRDQICDLAREVIYFPTDAEVNGSDRSLTFFGGLPTAPESFAWPRNAETGAYYAFMGQLDVSDLPQVEIKRLFPESGVLFFFLSDRPETTGKVLYHSSPSDDWKDIPQPDEVEADWYIADHPREDLDKSAPKIWPKRHVRPTKTLDYPVLEDFRLYGITTDDASPEQKELFKTLSNALHCSAIDAVLPDRDTHRDYCHKSGGFPGNIQADHYENDFDHYLLLELGRDSEQHWWFGGIFQFWIKRDDLEEQRWEKAFATSDGS